MGAMVVLVCAGIGAAIAGLGGALGLAVVGWGAYCFVRGLLDGRMY